MKTGQKVFNCRSKLKSMLEGVKNDIATIENRKDILQVDKKNLTEHTLEKRTKQIGEFAEEAKHEASVLMSEASSKLKTARKVDGHELAQKAQVLGPALSNMKNEELLNLYKNNFLDKTMRTLLTELIDLKVNASEAPWETQKDLITKFDRLQNEMRPHLPPDEKEALDKYDEAKQVQDYANKLDQVVSVTLKSYKGMRTEFDEAVKLKALEQQMDAIEKQ